MVKRRIDTAAQYGSNNLTGKPLEHYLDLYRKSDPHRISSRLGIPYEPLRQELTFAFLGGSYVVRHPDFSILPENAGEDRVFCADDRAKILLLRYLLYASVFPHNGEFKSYREFPSGELYYDVFQSRCIRRLAGTYGGRLEEFRQTAQGLGAISVPGADAACELEVFDGLLIRFQLWENDGDFPASCQILFSSNFPAAFSTYDLTEIVELILRSMKKVQKGDFE